MEVHLPETTPEIVWASRLQQSNSDSIPMVQFKFTIFLELHV